jgi:uncharacterized protein involved in response to NO
LKPAHAEFSTGFVHWGLLLALSAGFGLAALLAGQLAFDLSLGYWWPVLVQVHGHAQVFGWLGLFIMGVSLYFVPRFAGAPLRFAALAPWSASLLGGGIALRAGALGALHAGYGPWRWGLGLATLAECLAVFLYAFLLLSALRGADPRHRAIRPLRPYFLSALAGWALSILVVNFPALKAFYLGTGVLDPAWGRLGLDLFAGMVLLPVAFAFSIRTFPLYLRLPAVRWNVQGLAQLYLLALGLEMIPRALELGMGMAIPRVHGLGQLLKGGAVLAFIWKIDLLTRRQPPWIIERQEEPPPKPRFHPKPRPGLPDYGEFGHFEWLVYAAYAWLAVGAALEVYSGAGALLGQWRPFAEDGLRHAYLAGFGSLLLLGMAPRLIPGFRHQRGPAFPWLVDLTFWLASGSALLRLLHFFVPEMLWTGALPWLFGISGLLGWLAVAALAINLWWSR